MAVELWGQLWGHLLSKFQGYMSAFSKTQFEELSEKELFTSDLRSFNFKMLMMAIIFFVDLSDLIWPQILDHWIQKAIMAVKIVQNDQIWKIEKCWLFDLSDLR